MIATSWSQVRHPGRLTPRAVLALVALLALPARPVDAQSVTAAELHSAMSGRWVGTYEFLDRANPGQRRTIPATFEVSARESGGVLLHVTFDNGPGKLVTVDDRFVLANDGTTLDWTGLKQESPEIFRVLSLQRDAATHTIRLLAEFDDEEGGRPAIVHETITLSGTELTVLKAVRTEGADFAFRQAFRLTR